jgi:outer membrane protein assembly factor BamB
LEYLKGSSSSNNNHHDHHVAATSWDGTLRVFDTATGTALLTQTMESGPLLSLAIASPTRIVTGGLDGSGT